MQAHQITVPKTAHFYTSGEASQAALCCFVLHGYGQLGSEIIHKFDHLKIPIYVVALEGLSRFYWEGMTGKVAASWMTKADREEEIKDYCNYLDLVYAQILPSLGPNCKKIVLGFSQGGTTAMRWLALRQPMGIEQLMLWGSDIPADLDYKLAEPYLSQLQLDWVYGNQDIYLTPDRIQQLKKRFEQFGLKPIVTEFEGGHELNRVCLSNLLV